MKHSHLYTTGLLAVLTLLLVGHSVTARGKRRPPIHHHHPALHTPPILVAQPGYMHPTFLPGVGVIPQVFPGAYMPVPFQPAQPPVQIQLNIRPERAAPLAQPRPAPKMLHLQVFLPVADAEVWLDGKETTEKGKNRGYTLDDLVSGQVNQVAVKAQWRVDGDTITREQKVSVSRGATTIVDFTRARPQDR